MEPQAEPRPRAAGRQAPAARRWVPIRTLGPRHRARVLEHLLALDNEDRTRRFGHQASDERIRQYVEQMDFEGDAIFGVFDRRLRLGALVHLAFGGASSLDDGSAEFGISIWPDLRQRGIGTLLFEHACTLARNRRVRNLVIHMARDNAAMLAIVRGVGAKLSFEGSDAIATLPLEADTLVTQLQELFGHQAAEWDYRLKLQGLRTTGA